MVLKKSFEELVSLSDFTITVADSLVAIVATAGAATPLVVAAGATLGTGTALYGYSNMIEAEQDIIYGSLGDSKSFAVNPIRDTIFLGNNQLYHQTGQIFSIGSSIIAPIGQTGSVVKGLAQFGGGALGAWGGGELGYHGAKLLGASDSQANAAKFLSSMAGASAGSSLAGKFSLNDVGKTKVTSFMDEMSPEDARRYEQWNKLVADGLDPEQRMWIQDFGTPNTYFEFKKHNPSQNISDYQDLVLNQSPWPKGYTPQKTTLKSGDTFEMAMGPERIQLNDWSGGFGTDSGTISSKDYVYNDLAVKSDWKPELERVVQYRVKEGVELPVQVGPVGPQIDVQVDKYLPGGASQIQMLVDPVNRMDYLEIISVRYFE